MTKRIIGIVLVILALVTAGLGIVAAGNVSGNKEIINNAVVADDGKLLPENEGKVVIVQGTLDADLPFVDRETGIKIDSVVAYRNVEKVTIQEETEDKEEDEWVEEYWEWNVTLSEKDYGGSKKLFAPNVTLGEFAVEEELLEAIGTPEERTEYTDKKELNQMGWKVFKDGGRTVLYTGNDMPDEGDYVGSDYLDYQNTLRVSYKRMAENLDYTVIGLQQDGQLVKVAELDMLSVHEGTLTAEDLLTYNETSAKTSTITAIAIAVVLAGAGSLLIVKGNKKKI